MATFDVGKQHEEMCLKYPISCPNKCDVGTVPRCDVKKHLTECPLELVACEFAEVGCSVKVPRRDLKSHMEESQQHHLLSATLLNLKLTRETIAEKDHLLALKEQQLAEKEHQIADRDKQLAAKDYQIADKDKLLVQKDHQIAAIKQQLAKKDEIIILKDEQMLEAMLQSQQGVLEFLGRMDGFTCHRITLEKFSDCQKERMMETGTVKQFSLYVIQLALNSS